MGEIIQPGKWGRETLAFAARGRRGIQNDSDAIILIWEAALEAARLVRFPEAVSRLDCVFAIELNSSILRHLSPSGITGLLLTPSLDLM